MADPTAFDLADYQTIDYALRDYVQMLEEAVESDMRKYWAGTAPPSQWLPDLQQARAAKRKIRRRLGRLRKPEPQPEDCDVVGLFGVISRSKLTEVQRLLANGLVFAGDKIAPQVVEDYLINTDRRTADGRHQRALDELDAEDLAEWIRFTYLID